MLVAFELVVLVPSLYAQQNKARSDSPQAAWSNIQQFVKDTSVTDLHSASDEGSQADAETALKAVESALDQLKAQDPEATLKSTH